MARKTLDEIMATPGSVDWEKLNATTEDDIRRHQIEDDDPDAPLERGETTVLPQAVRRKLGMTQEQFAAALRVPLATLRNWEQGRVRPDPAARSLLLVVYRAPEAALKELAA